MDNNTELQKHIEFKKTSVNTNKIKDIERYLEKFINFIDKDLLDITEDDLAKFLNSLTKKYSISTINDIKAYLKVFIKWEYADWSSRFRNLDRLCRRQKPPRAYEPEQMLSIKEVERLVKAEPDLMYKVYWLVLFYGGFRPSEACNLKWDNVSFEKDGAIIKIRTTKTSKVFYKSLPRNVEHLLKELRKHNHSEFLFPSPMKKDRGILARSVCSRLKRLSKNTLGKDVVPYQLRHSIATILYNDDKRKDDDCANQMGHSKNMKEIYMNLSGEQQKARARTLWIKTKPLSPEERDRIKELEAKMESITKLLVKLSNEKEKDPNIFYEFVETDKIRKTIKNQ